jgi:hypothetical protein
MDKLKGVTGGATALGASVSKSVYDLAQYNRLQQIIKIAGSIGHW